MTAHFFKCARARTGTNGVRQSNLGVPKCCSEDFATTLSKLPEVVEGHYTDGDEDMLLKVVTGDPENLKEVLNQINAVEGIANTKTIISVTNSIREY